MTPIPRVGKFLFIGWFGVLGGWCGLLEVLTETQPQDLANRMLGGGGESLPRHASWLSRWELASPSGFEMAPGTTPVAFEASSWSGATTLWFPPGPGMPGLMASASAGQWTGALRSDFVSGAFTQGSATWVFGAVSPGPLRFSLVGGGLSQIGYGTVPVWGQGLSFDLGPIRFSLDHFEEQGRLVTLMFGQTWFRTLTDRIRSRLHLVAPMFHGQSWWSWQVESLRTRTGGLPDAKLEGDFDRSEVGWKGPLGAGPHGEFQFRMESTRRPIRVVLRDMDDYGAHQEPLWVGLDYVNPGILARLDFGDKERGLALETSWEHAGLDARVYLTPIRSLGPFLTVESINAIGLDLVRAGVEVRTPAMRFKVHGWFLGANPDRWDYTLHAILFILHRSIPNGISLGLNGKITAQVEWEVPFRWGGIEGGVVAKILAVPGREGTGWVPPCSIAVNLGGALGTVRVVR